MVQIVHNYNYFPGKTTFLMTNSPFESVNAGMIYVLGQDWQRLFDIMIVNSKKTIVFFCEKEAFPGFFTAHRKTEMATGCQFTTWKNLLRSKYFSKGGLIPERYFLVLLPCPSTDPKMF